MKTTQEQIDDLTAKVFRLEAIATRLSKAERQLTELTRNDSWLADRCKDIAARLAKLESGKAEVQDGGEVRRLSAALDMRTDERDRLIDAHTELEMQLARTEEALTRLMAVHSYTGGPGGWRREGGPVWPLETAIEGIEATGRVENEKLRKRVSVCEIALDSRREEIGKYNARVAKLEGELRERTDELGAAQRLIAEAYNIDDDVMVALGDPVKGAEAEELRKGVEDLIKAADSNDGVVSWHALQSLLDRVNARDSNAFLAQREKAPTLPLDREHLGRIVREVWIAWAKEQPNPKPSWLVPWEGLSEPDKEVDRRIGKRLAMEGVVVIEGQLERAETEAKNLREKLAAKGVADVDIEAMHVELTAAGWRMRPGHGWSFGPYACGYFKSTKDAHAAMTADRTMPTPINKAAALRDAGWEERVLGWSPDGGYSAWTLDGAYDAMVAARVKATPARLDPGGTAKPLTRIVTHAESVEYVGPGTPLAQPEHVAADGTRTPLVVDKDAELEASGWTWDKLYGWTDGDRRIWSTDDAHAVMLADKAEATPALAAIATPKSAEDVPPPAAPESAQELWAAGWHWSYRNGWTSKDHTKPLSTGQAHAVMLADRRRVRGL